jgi:hypothetical protein
MKLEFSQQIFKRSSNIKFHGNPSGGSQFFNANGRLDRDRRRDMIKLLVTFRKFAKAPEDSQASGQAAYVPVFRLKGIEISDKFFAIILSSATCIHWAS